MQFKGIPTFYCPTSGSRAGFRMESLGKEHESFLTGLRPIYDVTWGMNLYNTEGRDETCQFTLLFLKADLCSVAVQHIDVGLQVYTCARTTWTILKNWNVSLLRSFRFSKKFKVLFLWGLLRWFWRPWVRQWQTDTESWRKEARAFHRPRF